MTQWIELSRSALRHNVRVAKAHAPKQQCWPCVKANAYGHGLAEVIVAIDDLTDGYCVVSTTEALQLRKLTDKFVFVLNIVDPDDISACVEQDITLPLASERQARWYARLKQNVKVHLEVDTGMARTGFKWSSPNQMLEFVQSLPTNIEITGLWSHYAAVGENSPFTKGQYEQFADFVKVYRQEISSDIVIHLDKSGSVLLSEYDWEDDWRGAFRLGIATYGFDPAWPGSARLRPVLSWKTSVISVRSLQIGEPVGYGLTFIPDKPTNIATIPVGYADGYPRPFSNVGHVLVRGIACPVRGRICMNLSMIEVPSTIKEGDEVVLLGEQDGQYLDAFRLASWIDTTHYEIVTRLHPSIPRVLID